MGFPVFSFIIPTQRRRELLGKCIDSIQNQEKIQVEIIIVDNEKSDKTKKIIQEDYPKVKYISNKKKYGWGHNLNKGFKRSSGDFIVTCNDDLIFKKNWCKEIYKAYKKTRAKVLGGILKSPNSRHGYGWSYDNLFRLRPQNKPKDKKPRKVDLISAGLFAVKKDLYNKIKGFSEEFGMYWEDQDFQLKASKYTDLILVPNAECLHLHSSKGRNKKITYYFLMRNRFLIYKKFFNKSANIYNFIVSTFKELPRIVIKSLIEMNLKQIPGAIKWILKGYKDGVKIFMGWHIKKPEKIIRKLN